MLEFALSDVEQAFKQLEFAIKLMCYCERGDLDKEKFDSDVIILLDEENIGFPDGSFHSDQEIVTASQINVGICFGVSAIVLDAAFGAAKIECNPNSRDPKDELRTLVYMARCAFAHNLAKPCWEARGDFARNIQLNLGFAQTTWLFWRMGYLSKWLAISAPALMFIHAILTSIPVISAAVDTALGRPIIKYKTTHHRGDETRMPSDSSPT